MSTSPTPLRARRVAAQLALADLWHDRNISLCLVAALAAAITPLLLLLGLKTGVIETLRERLLNDPRNLEVRIRGNWALPPDWFERMRQRPDVAFVIPLTRSLNTQLDLRVDSRRFLKGVEVMPTAEGDPLLAAAALPVPVGFDQVLLSFGAAQSLGLAAGDSVGVSIPRRRDGRDEWGRAQLQVLGVLPEAAIGSMAVFTTLDFLVAIEDFRDGAPDPRLGVGEGNAQPPRKVFARARLYARGLDDVSPLAARVRQDSLEVDTRAQEIETVQSLDRVFGVVLKVIGGLAGLGAAAALVGSFLANIDRKRRDLAFMRLAGFSIASLALFPALQALAIGLLAYALALAGYALGALMFDRLLGSQLVTGEYLCRLDTASALLVGAMTISIALVAAALGGYRAARVDPAESLRAS